MEDVLFSVDLNEDVDTHRNGIAALHLTSKGQQVLIGVAFCDPVLQILKVAQLIDDITLTNLQVE